jgi:hypothetical protein
MASRAVWLGLVSLLACNSTPKPTETHPATAPSASAQAEDVTSARIVVLPVAEPTGTANPRVLGELPPTDPSREDMFEARHMGFSSDDAYLGYEISTCDPCSSEFHFTSPTKPPLDFAYYSDPGNWDSVKEKKQNDETDRKVKELGVTTGTHHPLRGPFPFPDLVFASKADRNDVTGKVTLFFGAHVAGYAPVFPMRIDLGPSPMFGTKMDASEQARVANLPPEERKKALRDWNANWLLSDPMLMYANVTKDGSDIGIVAVTTGTMWFEAAAVARTSARSFAGQVYNDTAMRLHQSKLYVQAAALFEKAEIASPTESLFSYNLACAWARTKDARAKDALARAIAHGGDAIKTRAQADADFGDVAGEGWFTTLVH